MDYNHHPWNFPGKNTGVSCHFPLQGIFLTQGSSALQADSLLLCHQENPSHSLTFFFNHFCACFALFAFSSSWNSAFVYFDFDSFVFNCLISFWDFHFCFLFWMCICFFGAFLILFLPFVWDIVCLSVFNHCCLLVFVFVFAISLRFHLFAFIPSFFNFIVSLFCQAVQVADSWFQGQGSGLNLWGGSTESKTLKH